MSTVILLILKVALVLACSALVITIMGAVLYLLIELTTKAFNKKDKK